MRRQKPRTGAPPLRTCTATFTGVRCEARPGHVGRHHGRAVIGGRWLFWTDDTPEPVDPVAQARADLEAAIARRQKQGATA